MNFIFNRYIVHPEDAWKFKKFARATVLDFLMSSDPNHPELGCEDVLRHKNFFYSLPWLVHT